jgi:hypothetical protein
VPETAQQVTVAAEPQAPTKERRPELSATTGTVEPVVAHAKEEARAEVRPVDIAKILGAPTMTVVRSSLRVKSIFE